jgi:hypothetical protein
VLQEATCIGLVLKALTTSTPIVRAILSLVGYWYWLLCPPGEGREKLRGLSGWKAKQVGRELRAPDYPSSGDLEFRRKICLAIDSKIERCPRLKELLKNNTLPITHYYVYGGLVRTAPGSDWVWEYYMKKAEELRS